MAGIKDQENIEELKQRLYERGSELSSVSRSQLKPQEIEVSRGWTGVSDGTPKTEPVAVIDRSPLSVVGETGEGAPDPVFDESQVATLAATPRRRYRMVILVVSLVFFVLTTLASSTYLFFGSNQISAKNINLTVTTPFALAGGETATMQATIANNNSVAVSSATLIINYPSGTRSIEEGARELYEERIPIAGIAPGEAINIPFRAVLYGEENEDKPVKVAIEYRVEGSNGTFFKEADPQVVKITSSPLVVRATGVDKISSGQDLVMTLLVQSNSASVQKNILVSTSYPSSFGFTRAEPEPAYGQNSWLIEELPANGSVEIKVTGRIDGLADENAEIQVKVGNPQLDNQFLMGSVLSQSRFSYTIEQPFTGVTVDINGDRDGEAVIAPDDIAQVRVTVSNTLREPVFDMRVALTISGNLIRDDLFEPEGGFYDASQKTLIFDVSGQGDLGEVGPGETRNFSFRVLPDPGQGTAAFSVSASVYARRVNERSAAESLIGTAAASAKYSSAPQVLSELGYSNGPFTDSGAIPPVATLPTTYTVTLVAEAGVNDMTKAVVTANLPQYASWLDSYEGEGTVEFNPVAKQLKWNVGDISAKATRTLQFQVSVVPSVTQVGRPLVVIGAQELRATDRFTGVNLRAQGKELINELSTELGFVHNNGVVQANRETNN